MERFFCAIAECFNFANKTVTNRRNLRLSVVSLLLAVLVLVVSCSCWYSLSSTTDSGRMSVNAGNGLVLNGGVGQSTMLISDKVKLLPASTVDGYNLYFPSDGYFSKDTEEIVFRRANAGDKNKTFLQVDFTLASEMDSADVFLGEGSQITVTGSKSQAVRLAVITGLAENPVILNPTSGERTVSAVSDISRFTGAYSASKLQNSYPVANYRTQPLISLKKGETSNISLIIWVEGTDTNCVNDISGEKINIKLELTTNTNAGN